MPTPRKKAALSSLATVDLRRRAERALTGRHQDPARTRSDPDLRRMVHELEVHEVELQLQNEELQATRTQLESALRRYTDLVDFAPIGYACVSETSNILELNHAGARILGRPRNELARKRLESLLVPESRSELRSVLSLVVQGGGASGVELTLAGGQVRLRLHAALVPGDGEVILLAFDDVTDWRTQQERLRRSEGRLREADRRKDGFLAALSHELRNPLAAIRSAVQLESKVEPGGRAARRAHAVIDRQASLLTRLIDDLLDVSRITRGKLGVERRPVDLSELTGEVLESHRPAFESSGLALESDVAPGPVWVLGDSARLQQVLGNLLTNAEKFTPPGGKVAVRLQRKQGLAVLEVCDNGVGVDLASLPDLFEPFAQGPQSLDRSPGGLGLGLTLVKRLVELHGGEVSLKSEGPGLGTEVRVRLPLSAAPATEEAEAPRGPCRSRRVLLIDDNTDMADGLKDLLEAEGHHVRVAYDGPSGIELARAWLPEIAICDIGLPGLDGYAVARAFRADPQLSRVHLIALSGYVRSEDAEKALRAGYERHIAKPPTLEIIDRVFDEMVPEGSPAG